MVRSTRIDLFCEDQGHELFVRALVDRLTREPGRRRVALETRNSRGGHGRAVTEFRAWQRLVSHTGGAPDLLVLVIDGNCSSWHQARRTLLEAIDPAVFPHAVVGCPDPHIERWCFADPPSYARVAGALPPPDPGKCERQLYKRLLAASLAAAGQHLLTGAMEIAPDLVSSMDLYRAGQRQPSLGNFVEELKAALRRLAAHPT